MMNPEIHEDRTASQAEGTAPNFAAASDVSYARTLFVGPDGLRPGWGLVSYFVMFFILQRILLWLASLHDFGASGLWTGLLQELGNFLAAVIPAIVLARVERRPWKSYGLPLRNMLGERFWTGVVWGFAAISLLIFVLYGLRAFSFGHVELRAARVFRFAIFWAAMFLLVGLFEEFWLRGYALFTLARGIGFWPAALSLSCAFGLIHLRNDGEHWPGLLAAALIGLFFCLTLKRTGNLWFAIGFHAAWDWGETFFYSVPDSGLVAPGHLLSSSLRGPDWLSGGSTGPEGSVVCFVVIALCWISFAWRYPRAAERSANSEALLQG
jgi:uncharacterized protein